MMNNQRRMVTPQMTNCECKITTPQIQYKAPDQYPPVTVENPNRQYAQILKQSAFSSKSEMSSITQYLYQSWVFKPKYPEISEHIMKIAQVEMHHLNILGEMVVLLDGNPTFAVMQRNYPVFWQGNMIRYNQPLTIALRNNILAEQQAVDGYSKQIAVIKDECVCAVLRSIILDEQVHIQLFKDMLAGVAQ